MDTDVYFLLNIKEKITLSAPLTTLRSMYMEEVHGAQQRLRMASCLIGVSTSTLGIGVKNPVQVSIS